MRAEYRGCQNPGDTTIQLFWLHNKRRQKTRYRGQKASRNSESRLSEIKKSVKRWGKSH